MSLLLQVIILVHVSMGMCEVSKQRNILLIMADDLGWNDIGFHNTAVKTPVLDKLALSGVILNQLYAQPVCTPSRTSAMTGFYPFRAGKLTGVILPQEAICAAPDRVLLPQRLKKLHYATHLVGKWHLGMCNWNCTPTFRGFDSFYGLYNGGSTHYTKTIMGGRDFRDNEEPISNEEYSTHLFRDRAIDIIHNHDKSAPLFLFLSFQAPHSPLEVPEKYEQLYPNITSNKRRVYSAMISAMDEAIGKVQEALEETGLIDDTLIIFSSDNGAIPTSTGNNLPFRGAKCSVYEGGTRVASFASGSGLENTSHTYNGLMHFSDWFPTILEAAGDTHYDDGNLDGVSQWVALRHGVESPREEVVYNVDIEGQSAIRLGDYKLIEGYPGPFRDWYQVGQEFRPDLIPFEGYEGLVVNPLVREDRQLNPAVFEGVQLYDLRKDPEERMDISKSNPGIVARLSERLKKYRSEVVPKPEKLEHPKSDPSLTEGFWTPGWC